MAGYHPYQSRDGGLTNFPLTRPQQAQSHFFPQSIHWLLMKNYTDDANNWGSYFKYSLIGEEGNELINGLKVLKRSNKQANQFLFPSTTINSLCLFVSEFLSLRLGSCKLVVRGSERKSSMETTKLIETLLLS